MSTLSERIHWVMQKYGLTQKQLAEKMGTKQANISRFEIGNANSSLALLQKNGVLYGQDAAHHLCVMVQGRIGQPVRPFLYSHPIGKLIETIESETTSCLVLLIL